MGKSRATGAQAFRYGNSKDFPLDNSQVRTHIFTPSVMNSLQHCLLYRCLRKYHRYQQHVFVL